jgi:hypothetical protein
VRKRVGRAAALLLLLAAAATLTSACYSARIGFWPAEHLPELQPGVSTQADVVALLGTPLGRGAARFTPEMPRREVWAYGFMNFSGTSTSNDEGMLLVFFDGDRYDGYYWTALGKTPKPQSGATRR